jgi:hypothetical protein
MTFKPFMFTLISGAALGSLITSMIFLVEQKSTPKDTACSIINGDNTIALKNFDPKKSKCYGQILKYCPDGQADVCNPITALQECREVK